MSNTELRESIARTHQIALDQQRIALAAVLIEAMARKACLACVRHAHRTHQSIEFVSHRSVCPRTQGHGGF